MTPQTPPLTSAAHFTRSYVALLVSIMVAVSLSILMIVGSTLIQAKQEHAHDFMEVVTQTFADNRPDWDYYNQMLRANPRTNFVRVTVTPKQGAQRVYYSHGTRQFLQQTYDTWPVLHHVQYRDDQGLFFHMVKRRTNQGAKVTINLWLSLNNLLHLYKIILLTIVGITALGVLVGAILISWLTRRLNAPLMTLTAATKTLNHNEDMTYHETLPIPAGPQEVHDLGVEINRLLQTLNAQVRRDRQFVSDASHELRTPLAAIRGHVALIRRHGATNPELVPNSLATIDDESKQMQQLVESLLRLSRMDNVQLPRVVMAVTPLIQEATARFARQSDRAVKLEVQGQWLVEVNADSVVQILISLLSNADKYSPQAAPITLRVAHEHGAVQLQVIDQGQGVAPEDQPHIFDRFYRADTSRSKAIPGSGLGLAIAQRLAVLNGGYLSVHNNTPHGAIFTLTLADKTPASF